MIFKLKFAIVVAAFSVGLNAQEVLIPFKKENRFGLIDKAGKIVMKPQFDELIWLTGKYFVSTVRSDENELHGLIFKDKELIKPLPNAIYKVVSEMMILAIVKDNNKTTDSFTYDLYNYKGEKINLPKLSSLDLIKTFATSNRNPKVPKYALLYVRDSQQHSGIFLYNADESRVEEWLFKDGLNFKMVNANKDGNSFYFSFVDTKGKENLKELKITQKDYSFSDVGSLSEIPTTTVGTDKNPIEKTNEVRSPSREKKSLYREENGKLLFSKDELTFEVKLSQDMVPIFKYSALKNQTGNLIYKENQKFGLIVDSLPSQAVYDSLAYFGNDYFMACQKMDSKLKCGTLDLNLKTAIPIEYDSILGVMNRYEFVPKTGTKDFELKLKADTKKVVAKEISFVLPVTNSIVGYKNGKVFLMKADGSLILPTGFDEIGRNAMKLQGESKTDFIVLKKDNLYGVILSVFDPVLKENVQLTIEPSFKFFPTFYIDDYYGEQGEILIGLHNKNGHFEAYASDFGFVYSD